MHTFALISQKGGAGKSTLSTQLAALAGQEAPAYLIDRDQPQNSASKWWNRRQDIVPAASQPELVDLDGASLSAAVEQLRPQAGALFVDTRPAVTEREAEAARVIDLAIVPVRPSGLDLEAVGDTLAMLRRLDRRAVIVVNAAKTDGRARDARAALSVYPVPVCPHFVADRAVYQDAIEAGRSVFELRGHAAGRAAEELRAVWQWIKGEAHV